jgi:S-adenosylmethionine uptake transporter
MRGALLMVGSMACFTFGDACIKAIGDALPLSQILVIRGFAATLFLLGLAVALGQWRMRVSRGDAWFIALRSVAEIGAAFSFLTALRNMPFANVTALLQMLPLTVTLASALVFGDPVGWRRWTAIGVGFLGMLLIVRPGTEGFDSWSLYALAAVACVTVRDLAVRRISGIVPSLTVTVWTAAGVFLAAGLWSLGQDWAPVTARSAWLLAGASALIVAAYTLSVAVMRVGEISFVAPFRYTGLVWALILGLVLFGEWPEPVTLIGAAIIVATGIFTILREARLARRKA